MSIQSVNTVDLIITLVTNEIRITAETLCSTLRYVIYICYLSSIFMICAVTIHLWLVITRRKLSQAKRNERWYYIVPFALAISLSATMVAIPNSAYGITNRCTVKAIPTRDYLIIRWCLYYGWFVVASAISLACMASVLKSVRRLTYSTNMQNSRYPASTEAYRNAVNARANGKRLRSEGFMFSLAFFSYPAVLHSIRDVTRSAVQYWVTEQEEFWRMRQSEARHGMSVQVLKEDLSDMLLDRSDVRNFTSRRGRFYHFILVRTPEGKIASGL
ncbi:hypothetical protein GGH13_001098 [Coemansia sp. S155-1]|nr:hypothetical protein GGH13_001098 [Coemansia sp. S155-1]